MARVVQNKEAIAVKKAAIAFFGRSPYSSARINGGRTWRLSIPLDGFAVRSCANENALTSKKLTPAQKAELVMLQVKFSEHLLEQGLKVMHLRSGLQRLVDLQFHVGSGVYAKVLIPLDE